MGKSTISMVIFNNYVSHYQRDPEGISQQNSSMVFRFPLSAMANLSNQSQISTDQWSKPRQYSILLCPLWTLHLAVNIMFKGDQKMTHLDLLKRQKVCLKWRYEHETSGLAK